MRKYLPQIVEKKWQEKWSEVDLYRSKLDDGAKKYYVLAEFAYPSGDLHIGHIFTWTGADVFARFKRMQGYNVFFPNGFDAFGLPAENAAIKRGTHPQDWTYANIESMKRQFGKMGGSFSFDHEVITCDPSYYKWNQWLFVKMFERGLAYRGKALSNWCESCQTVLANEGVIDGKCWRCDNPVVQKEIAQWFWRITDYADRLVWDENRAKEPRSGGLDWPKSVKEGQNNWIGRSEGMIIKFQISNLKFKINNFIEVYTVFPETIFGVTYLVVAPEYPRLKSLITPEQQKAVDGYVKQALAKTEEERKIGEKDKTGVFTGSYVINPVNGAKVPVWVADYVIGSYGTGAVMGVPGSDHRDFEFAKKYGLPIIRVIGQDVHDLSNIESADQVLEEGVLVNSGQFDGLSTPLPSREKIKDWLADQGWGKRQKQYHLRDWSVSRQRYWGTPVPIINCGKCGAVAVPESDLPVLLPYEVDFTPKGKPPLATDERWLHTKCPKCGGEATREAETMDTFVDSSWYFFRYLDPKNSREIFATDKAKKWLPVDIYFGGAEHTLGHTLYARFVSKVIQDLGLVEFEEFARKRVNHGIILGPDGNKMSKSKGNVVNPDKEIDEYGADTIRTFLGFFMPYDGVGAWIPEKVSGVYRFLQRVWAMCDIVEESVKMDRKDLFMMNKTIKDVTVELEVTKFNTAIAKLMEWLNYLSAKAKVSHEEYTNLLKLLAPFAPFLTEELYQEMRDDKKTFASIHHSDWPVVDESALKQELITLPVQINGKLRANLEISPNASQSEVEAAIKQNEKLSKYLTGQETRKVVYIPGKIVSLVVGK